ncbi:unnamed protein product [Paramecium sonneborni]|uniref:t-SNARE coiled-coil homology domain-containing protein n=1 Tax=Paramecium sonneborni TaxID=65129 RepID=A0A8S1P559_9CILI|nr:unnamed protein product [Paramecium sonneborni]
MKKNNNILQKNLEEENILKQDELLEKVQKIKHVSLNIQTYLKNEKPQLDKLNNDYDKSIDMVKKSINGIGKLLKSSFGQNTCFLICIVFMVIFILYLL